jgi:signal transduction histidine kinase
MSGVRPLLVVWLAASVLKAQGELLVHLPFDTSGADASGHNHAAMAHGAAGCDRKNFQIGGGAATFGGTNSYFNIPRYTPVSGDGARTAAFWVRSTNVSVYVPSTIFLGWGDAGFEERVRYDIGLEYFSSARLRIEFNNGYFGISSADNVNLVDGKWHHILTTYQSNRVAFCVDGKAYGFTMRLAQPLMTGPGAAGLVIGAGVRQAAGWTNAYRYFCGQIDDVGIWDSSLSQTDAALLNGLGRIGDNDLGWLETAHHLWDGPPGGRAIINGQVWEKTSNLKGSLGEWVQVRGANGPGSFIVLDSSGGGIRVLTHWWQTAAARMAGVLIAGLGLSAIGFWRVDWMRLRSRLKRLEHREWAENERRRIAEDLHDQIGADLTAITLLGELAREESLGAAETRTRVTRMNEKLRNAVRSFDEIVWQLNPRNDTLPQLVGYLQDSAQEFCRTATVPCRLDVDASFPPCPVAVKCRHNLLLAVKEALNNTIKHADASEVWLRVHCQDGLLRVAVEDNGRGFDPAGVRGEHNGLVNLQSRMTGIGARVEVDSRPGGGTRVELCVPLESLTG